MIYAVVLWFILVIVLVIIVTLYETSLKRKLKNNQANVQNIPKFSMALEYHVDAITPDTNLNGDGNTAGGGDLYDCSATSLHKCDIDDARTLFGCKELMVTCTHFEKDTPYIDKVNDKTIIIPKNQSPTEGYALAIRVLADSCNPYHGDLVLVALSTTSNEYMMICACKNPGYIGNTTVLGNCTSVFICDGKLVDIDKPLDQVECVCAQSDKNVRYDDGVPVCKPMSVTDANEKYPDDWSHIVPWNSDRVTNTSNFNKTIIGNLRTKLLLDPCRSSIDNTTIEIPNGKRNELTNECNFLDYGYPIQANLFDDSMWTALLPPPAKRPDGGTYPPYKRTFIDGALITGIYDILRFSDRINAVDRLYGIRVASMPDDSPITKEKAGRVVIVPPAGISLGKNQVLHITALEKTFMAPACIDYWPTYSCHFTYHYGYDYDGLSVAKNEPLHGGFWWNYDDWISAESMVETAIDKDRHADGFAFTANAFELMPNVQPYGFQWCSPSGYQYNYDNKLMNHTCSGVIVFKNSDDWKKHLQVKT